MVCLRQKTPGKTPHGPFLKKGRSKPPPPPRYRTSEYPPPPPGGGSLAMCHNEGIPNPDPDPVLKLTRQLFSAPW